MIAKRGMDLVGAGIGLIVLAPVFAVIALAIKVDSSGPVFFRQTRIGRHFRPFKIYKFRTMVTDAEKYGALVSTGDDQRITKMGHTLRKFKIDELPQLINVFSGEMSLVGPRPEVPRYVEVFRKEYEEILTVKPGITDFASLEYSDENEMLRGVQNPEEKYLAEILPAKIEFYRKYLREQSIWTDFKLIIKTIWKLFGSC